MLTWHNQYMDSEDSEDSRNIMATEKEVDDVLKEAAIYLLADQNLADVDDVQASRDNLGLGNLDEVLAGKANLIDDVVEVAHGGTGAKTKDDAWAALATYGTTEGTAVQGNDSRLGTVDGKTGGTISSELTVSATVFGEGGIAFYAKNNELDGDGPNRVSNGLRMQSSDPLYDSYSQYFLVKDSYHCTRIVQNGTATFTARSDGYCYANSFNPTSDGRLKFNREPILGALSRVEKLTGYTFDLFGERKAGLIAQDVREVLPEVVSETFTDHVLKDGTVVSNALAVDYGATTGLLVEAIKELNQQVFELKERLKALDGLDA